MATSMHEVKRQGHICTCVWMP